MVRATSSRAADVGPVPGSAGGPAARDRDRIVSQSGPEVAPVAGDPHHAQQNALPEPRKASGRVRGLPGKIGKGLAARD